MIRTVLWGLCALLARPALAAPAGPELIVVHEEGWRKNRGPLSVRLAGGRWQPVEPGQRLGPLALRAGKTVIEVKPPGGGLTVKRLAVLERATRYQLRGNPCATWELVSEKGGDASLDVTLDLSGLPATYFPLRVLLSRAEDAAEELLVDRPVRTEPLTPPLSAMCLHSGFPLRVVSATKGALFDAEVVLEPAGSYLVTLAVDARGTVSTTFARRL